MLFKAFNTADAVNGVAVAVGSFVAFEFGADSVVLLSGVLCVIVVARGDDDGGTEAESQYDGEGCCCCHFDTCLIVIFGLIRSVQ